MGIKLQRRAATPVCNGTKVPMTSRTSSQDAAWTCCCACCICVCNRYTFIMSAKPYYLRRALFHCQTHLHFLALTFLLNIPDQLLHTFATFPSDDSTVDGRLRKPRTFPFQCSLVGRSPPILPRSFPASITPALRACRCWHLQQAWRTPATKI